MSKNVNSAGVTFKNGISNAQPNIKGAGRSIFSGLPIQYDPTQYVAFHNDFQEFDADNWYIRKVEAGSAAGSVAADNEEKGTVTMTTDNAAGDLVVMAPKGAAAGTTGIQAFEWKPDHLLHFDIRAKIHGTNVDFMNTKAFFGLINESALSAWAADNASSGTVDSFGCEINGFFNLIFGGFSEFFCLMSHTGSTIRIIGDDASANEQTFSAGQYFHLAGTNRHREASNRNRLTPSPFGSAGSFNGLPLTHSGRMQPITNYYSVDTLGEVYDRPNKWYSGCHDAQADDGVIPSSNIPVGGLVPFIAMGNRANAGQQCKLTIDSFTIVQERV